MNSQAPTCPRRPFRHWPALLGSVLTLPCTAQVFQTAGELHGFGPASQWLSWTPTPELVVLNGDFNGDGLDDLVFFHRNSSGKQGRVEVALNSGGKFNPPLVWHNSFCNGAEIPLVGDFNGDGRADVVSFVRGTGSDPTVGDVHVGLSTGSSFVAQKWHNWFCIGDETPLVGDFNGDGRDDIATCTRGTAPKVYVALSGGSSFQGTAVLWHENFCPGNAIPLVGDFNGDGRCDLAAFFRRNPFLFSSEVRVTLSLPSSPNKFSGDESWHANFCQLGQIPAVGDVNADGRADLLKLLPGQYWGSVDVALSLGASFGRVREWHPEMPIWGDSQTLLTGRFNADSNADVLCLSRGQTQSGPIEAAWVSLAGEHSKPGEPSDLSLTNSFGYGTMGVPELNPDLSARPAQEQRHLLCILLAAPPGGDRTAFNLTRAAARQICFGPQHPNISDYFHENSGGRFRFIPADLDGGNGVIGPIEVSEPPQDETWTASIRLADPEFDFSRYDFDGDGVVTNRELCVLVFDNFSETSAANRTVRRLADGVQLKLRIGAAGHRSSFQNPTHELAHSLGTIDLYNMGCYAQGVTLMSCTAGAREDEYCHLDAWHKMRLGWERPRVFDLHGGAGGVLFSPAGMVGNSFFSMPPVIFHDSRRPDGMREYYIMEWRQTHLPGSAWRGYDQHVPAPGGLAAWYVRTDSSHNAYFDERMITAGKNGLLDTTVAGDDVRVNNQTITAGPNQFLDSIRAGDDLLSGDNTVLLTLTPADHASRRPVVLRNDPRQQWEPHWWTPPAPDVPFQDVPSGVLMRVQPNASRRSFGPISQIVHYLEWGERFSPWLDAPSNSALLANRHHMFRGDFGVRDRGDFQVSRMQLIHPGGKIYEMQPLLPLLSDQWDPKGAEFRLPLGAPTGAGYKLRIARSAVAEVISNSWPVSVANPYHDFIAAHFPPSQLADNAIAGPLADPDGDGVVNVVEFVTGGNPADPSDGPQLIQMRVPGWRYAMSWSCPLDRDGFFEVGAQVSNDLKTWSDVPEIIRKVEEDVALYSVAGLRGADQRKFLRLKVICPAGLD